MEYLAIKVYEDIKGDYNESYMKVKSNHTPQQIEKLLLAKLRKDKFASIADQHTIKIVLLDSTEAKLDSWDLKAETILLPCLCHD